MRMSSGTSALSVMPRCVVVECTRANTWKRVAPPATPCTISVGALGRRLGGIVLAASPRRRHPVERGEESEVRAAEHVAHRAARVGPRLGGHPHPDVGAGTDDRVDQRVAELGRERVTHRLTLGVDDGLLGGDCVSR